MNAPPAHDPPRLHRPRTVLLLGALVALAGVVDVVGQPSAPAAAVPLVAPGCEPTSAVPAPDAPGALPARIRVRYRPAATDQVAQDDPVGAAGPAVPADPAGTAGAVGVAAVVESVGHGVSYDVGPCQSMAATLYGSLPDGTTVHGTVAAGRRTVRGDGGGEVLLVDSATGARTLHDGREGFEGFSGWYGVVTDPVAGTYAWSSDVVWTATQDPSGGPAGAAGRAVARGRVTLTLVLGGPPHVPGGP